MRFQPYPFERLNDLIKNITPKKEIIKLTIGEPQFATPKIIQDEFKDSSNLLSKYPSSNGESYLYQAQIDFIRSRFHLNINDSEIIPTFGTREVLFNFPCFVFGFLPLNKKEKYMAFPNPFYQIYEGAAIASNAKIIYMKMDSQNGFKPSLSKNSLEKVGLVILNSPNNPTGEILSLDELKQWVKLALEYDFVVLNDECYSEIYDSSPPPSILEASLALGNKEFKNVLCINSISKRSSAPGLRSGFIAGDKEILKQYKLYRTYIGCAIPLPLQKASCVAWKSDSEVFRLKYAENLKIAKEILNTHISGYTFYVWLEIKDDLAFTKRLYENEGILVLPGEFLGRQGAGKGFARLALVYENAIIKDALERLKKWI